MAFLHGSMSSSMSFSSLKIIRFFKWASNEGSNTIWKCHDFLTFTYISTKSHPWLTFYLIKCCSLRTTATSKIKAARLTNYSWNKMRLIALETKSAYWLIHFWSTRGQWMTELAQCWLLYIYLKGGRPFVQSEQSHRSDDRCMEQPVTAGSTVCHRMKCIESFAFLPINLHDNEPDSVTCLGPGFASLAPAGMLPKSPGWKHSGWQQDREEKPGAWFSSYLGLVTVGAWLTMGRELGRGFPLPSHPCASIHLRNGLEAV